jgi:hypothetical protein
MTNKEKIDSFHERNSHASTMRRLSPLEREWLKDMEAHRNSLSEEEKEYWDNSFIYIRD